MVAESPYFRNYVFTGLTSGPKILRTLLDGLTDAEADFRPDPQRFTLREAVCHLADWEPIFLDRFKRTVEEAEPIIYGIDEGELAQKNRYFERDLWGELARFERGRAESVEFLQALPSEAWSRKARRDEIGLISLEMLVLLLPLHDSYHQTQVIDYRAAFRP